MLINKIVKKKHSTGRSQNHLGINSADGLDRSPIGSIARGLYNVLAVTSLGSNNSRTNTTNTKSEITA